MVDFDREKLEAQRTIGPTPLPSADGAVALRPDAASPDGALIPPAPSDASLDAEAPSNEDAAAADAALAADGASTAADDAGLDAALDEVGPLGLDATIVAPASGQ